MLSTPRPHLALLKVGSNLIVAAKSLEKRETL